MRKIETIFLDRDGTIGGDDTVHYPGVFAEQINIEGNLLTKQGQNLSID